MVDPSVPHACVAAPPGLETAQGAIEYGLAIDAVCRRRDPLPALRRAAAAGHPAAGADLAVLGGGPPPAGATAGRWLRQHRQIVAAAVADPYRAEALLRDHVTEFGCDPIALFVVAGGLDGIHTERLSDLRARSCRC
jgi:hypothetical protein